MINWKDKIAEKIFAEAGISDISHLPEMDKNSNIDIHSMRKHLNKETGEVDRQMTKITIGNNVYFLKQAFRQSFINIVNEFAAINILREFDLTPPDIAAYSLDDKQQKGFILLKDLKGFYSLKDLINNIAPQDEIDDFLNRKEEILKAVAERIRKVHQERYAYPDWFAKHLYIKKGSDEIALIDLERFRPLDKCPWYFGFPITSLFVKRKAWRKLRRSLKSHVLPGRLLRKILHE